MNASPVLRKSDNGVWYVHWTDNRRSKRVSARTTDLAAAKRFMGSWLLTESAQQQDGMTCGDIWSLYVSQHVDKHTICPSASKDPWAHLEPVFARLRPCDVSQALVDGYVSRRTKAAAISTVWKELRVLKTSWNYAVKQRRIASTDLPVEFRMPPPPLPRERWLRPEEVERLLEAARTLYGGDRLSKVERFIWLAIETAGRRDALEKLTWRQVDFETRVIHLNPAGRRQTSKRRASVPISDALLPILRRAYAERTGEWVLDDARHCVWGIDRAARLAGVGGVTPHVFRHTAATWMARRGVPLWQIAGVLGNTVAMVERVYAKHCPDGLAGAVNSISGTETEREHGGYPARAYGLWRIG